MNERIQQLSDIAYKNHLARNPHSSFGRRLDYEREFAELIVREMLVTCEEHPAWTGRMIGEQIKQHFGVEE